MRSSINRPPTPDQEEEEEEEEVGKEASLGDIINLKVLPARLPPRRSKSAVAGRLSFLFYLLGLGLPACYDRVLGLPAAADVLRMGNLDSILARVWWEEGIRQGLV